MEDFEVKGKVVQKDNNNDTIITLASTDMGAVMKENGELILHLPHIEDDGEVPAHVQIMIALMLSIDNDQSFVDEVMDRFYALAEEVEKDD